MAPEWTTGRTVALEPPRPVRIEQRGGSTVVVTSYLGTDGAAVLEALAGLWASPLGREREGGPGMPEPLGFDSRSGELTIAWVPGTRLAERGRVGAPVPRDVEVGNLLADLHGSGVVVEPWPCSATSSPARPRRHAGRRRSGQRSRCISRWAWFGSPTAGRGCDTTRRPGCACCDGRPRWPTGTRPVRPLERGRRLGAQPSGSAWWVGSPSGSRKCSSRGRLALIVSPDERPCSRRCTQGPACVRAQVA